MNRNDTPNRSAPESPAPSLLAQLVAWVAGAAAFVVCALAAIEDPEAWAAPDDVLQRYRDSGGSGAAPPADAPPPPPAARRPAPPLFQVEVRPNLAVEPAPFALYRMTVE